ncbi:hypothetical protein FA15DRAFT_457040 [Coprinopsis marcescibilis]|uniref:BTB domain-containing protein n=1 Tax=Coprinopsis marcescibilis TaxID=230819 RepID=A0A5C3L888_COPMA|nr:hypothetical protein FA15DRAFT_457040 [Coprinopsis marcescibilis]
MFPSTSCSFNFFDFPDGDVVLVATGSESRESPTQFRVHRCILSLGSPFFRDMFSLPQNPATVEKVPHIPVTEPGSVLDTLLRFIYPTPNPPVTSLEELRDVLGAAIKYEFEGVTATLRELLLSPHFLRSSPVSVYAIACRYDMDDIAKVASGYTLGVDLMAGPLSEDLKWITAYHYHQLLVLHKRRADAAISFLAEAPQDNLKCMQCNGSTFHAAVPPKWWVAFETSAREELSARPTTDRIFSLEFLYKAAAKGGCPRCPGSVLESWKFLVSLKEAIDDLNSTI